MVDVTIRKETKGEMPVTKSISSLDAVFMLGLRKLGPDPDSDWNCVIVETKVDVMPTDMAFSALAAFNTHLLLQVSKNTGVPVGIVYQSFLTAMTEKMDITLSENDKIDTVKSMMRTITQKLKGLAQDTGGSRKAQRRKNKMVEVTVRTDRGKREGVHKEEFKTGTRDLAVVTGISFGKTAEGETDCESVTQVIGVAEDRIWASIALAESTASALIKIAGKNRDNRICMMGAFIDTFFAYSTKEAGRDIMTAATKMVLNVHDEMGKKEK